jgi:hypothetical protein
MSVWLGRFYRGFTLRIRRGSSFHACDGDRIEAPSPARLRFRIAAPMLIVAQRARGVPDLLCSKLVPAKKTSLKRARGGLALLVLALAGRRSQRYTRSTRNGTGHAEPMRGE